jgi:hypothetical protein
MRRALVSLLVLVGACGVGTPAPPTMRPVTKDRAGIVNGTVDLGDPVEIYYQDNGPAQSGFLCSGELIGPHTVLSAGHCTNTKTASSPLNCPGTSNPIEYANAANEPLCTPDAQGNCPANTLLVAVIFNTGCTPSASGPSCEQQALSAGKYILADEIKSAPTYDPCASQLSDDIGVIHLSASVMGGGQAEPAILAVNTTDLGQAGTTLPTVRFVGYGITAGGANDSAIKRQVSKNNVQVANAGELYETLTSSDNGLTCSGDSGGPSFVTFNGVERIVAVTSRGDANCQQAGIDTRVDPFVPWINQVMASHNDGQVNGGAVTSTSTSSTSSSTTGTSGTTGATGTGPLCATCTVGGDCQSGVCVNIGTATAPQAVCSDHSCSTSTDCSSGESCFALQNSTTKICFYTGGSCPSGTSASSTASSRDSSVGSARAKAGTRASAGRGGMPIGGPGRREVTARSGAGAARAPA